MISSIIYTFVVVSGFVLSVQDIKYKSVSLLLTILFLSSCILIYIVDKYSNHNSFCFIPLLLFLIIGLITYAFTGKESFGYADYIIVLSVSFILKSEEWPIFLILCGMIGIISSAIFKQKQFPFIPSILLSIAIIKML